MGEDEYEGYEEQQLAAQREEDGLAGLSDALEEVARYHLESHDGEQEAVVAHTCHGHLNHLFVGCEDEGYIFGEELAHHKCQRSDYCGQPDCDLEHLGHSVVGLGAIVVSGNGLHGLVESHDDHHEDEGHLVHDAVGSYRIVASVVGEAAVDEDDHKARGKVHKAGREADGEYLLHDIALELVDAALEVDELALVAQHTHLPCQ